MIRINFLKPRKPFAQHREEHEKKWSMKEKRPYKCKLTDKDVLFCKKMYAELGPVELGKMFKVHPNTIRYAVQGITFSHLVDHRRNGR